MKDNDTEYLTMIELLIIQEIYNFKNSLEGVNPWIKVIDENTVKVELGKSNYLEYLETFKVIDLQSGILQIPPEYQKFTDLHLMEVSSSYKALAYLPTDRYILQALYILMIRGEKINREFFGIQFISSLKDAAKSISVGGMIHE